MESGVAVSIQSVRQVFAVVGLQESDEDEEMSCLGCIMTVLTLISPLMLLLGIIFYIVAIATVAWMTGPVKGQEGDWGLWEICIDSDCDKYGPAATTSLEMVRALHILALLAACGIMVLLWLAWRYYSKDGEKGSCRPKLIRALTFFSTISCVVADSVYAGYTEGYKTEFGYSWDLSITAGVFILISGWFISLIAKLSAQMVDEQEQPQQQRNTPQAVFSVEHHQVVMSRK